MSKELKLYFQKCTAPTDAYSFKDAALEKIGLESTFTFIDKIRCFKLTAKMICVNQSVFEETKKSIVIVKFEKSQESEK